MNSATLSAAMKAAFLGDGDAAAVNNDALQSFCDIIAQTVVAHIQSNGLVTVASGIAVATAGTAAAQTGATTSPGTGTIS
jgi:hypothetical protein